MPATELQVTVWRGTTEGAFEYFRVPRRESQTVLDVVTYIQRHLDPTLAYRFACRVGVCGSCAMKVNGVARWTCRTHVSSVVRDGHLEIAPLDHLPRVRDLVCDMAPFFEKWTRAGGAFVPAETGTSGTEPSLAMIDPQSPKRLLVEAGIECIGCGICYSECDTVHRRPDYLGPAALNRAWTLHNDERDGNGRSRLRAVAGDAGCHTCHSQLSCDERCPKHLTPAVSIAALKRASARAVLSGRL
jgi:fumarate reductase iron-sulfur subunit